NNKTKSEKQIFGKKEWIVIFFALINSGFVGFEIQKSANYLKVSCAKSDMRYKKYWIDCQL
ncbi:hypothetical protein, partial [Leuconostoc falkenbergense]|uniref:hypothetical protein n=1 Tax=Leuconostoc falkenbergense TaxID=2766470 RepID=UPI003BB20482